MSGTLIQGQQLPTVIGASGLVPQTPVSLYNQIIAGAQTLSPGITSNLPGSLIDDVTGTDTAALVLCDQARVELVNSLTPYGCNLFTLTQLGQIYLGQGSSLQAATNTSVYVQFTQTGGTGFVIAPGFTISDGAHQYVVAAPGGITGTGGVSGLIYAQAVQPGSWTVPVGTVNQIVTSLPGGINITVTNPSAGTPGGPAQTPTQYRAQVLQAGLVASTGMPNYLKTLLQNVPGVMPQLISVRSPASGKWEIIVGGTGDPYQIGLAIFQAVQDVSTLTGSTISSRNVTVNINSYPDTYSIPFVVPPVQTVTMVVTWNTSATNFVAPTSVANAVQAPLADYINALPVGAPINILELQDTFLVAVASLIPENLITVLVFSVSINGTVMPPGTGTQIITGDPESYFSCAASSVTVQQG